MAQNSGHDAPWLTITQTGMFSVYAGNARSSVSCRRCGGKLFYTHRPAALKLRSLELLCVREMKHDNDDDDFRSASGSQILF